VSGLLFVGIPVGIVLIDVDDAFDLLGSLFDMCCNHAIIIAWLHIKVKYFMPDIQIFFNNLNQFPCYIFPGGQDTSHSITMDRF